MKHTATVLFYDDILCAVNINTILFFAPVCLNSLEVILVLSQISGNVVPQALMSL